MSDRETAGEVPVFDSIRRRLSEMTSAERRVARTLLGGPATIGLESSTKLAGHAQVSGPTVIRFVNHLGFSTYAEFQEAVKVEVAARVTTPVELYPEASNGTGRSPAAGDALHEFSGSLCAAISETMSRLSSEDLNAAAGLLADARRKVLIVGGWFSSSLARHLAAMLQEMLPAVEFVDDAPTRRVGALCNADKRTTVVVFDFRRYEAETEKFARAIVEQGGKLILITDPWLSPLADVASAVLTASVGTPRPFESYVPALAVVEALTAQVVGATANSARARFERYSSFVDTLVPHWEHRRKIDVPEKAAGA